MFFLFNAKHKAANICAHINRLVV